MSGNALGSFRSRQPACGRRLRERAAVAARRASVTDGHALKELDRQKTCQQRSDHAEQDGQRAAATPTPAHRFQSIGG